MNQTPTRTIENTIARHYAQKDIEEIKADNDHLHIGGEKATRYFFDKIGLKPGMRVLDIGCGVGGPAILAAEEYGCHVSGVDLTPDFIARARERALASPAKDRLDFHIGNAQGLDFADATFDLAMMIHVGMNIPDKQPVYTEMARTLKSGGALALYEILALENVADMAYPCPWAATKDTSFLEDFTAIEHKLAAAGLENLTRESRRDYGINAMAKMLAVMGDTLTPARRHVVTNLLENIKKGACAPFIIQVVKP